MWILKQKQKCETRIFHQLHWILSSIVYPIIQKHETNHWWIVFFQFCLTILFCPLSNSWKTKLLYKYVWICYRCGLKDGDIWWYAGGAICRQKPELIIQSSLQVVFFQQRFYSSIDIKPYTWNITVYTYNFKKSYKFRGYNWTSLYIVCPFQLYIQMTRYYVFKYILII